MARAQDNALAGPAPLLTIDAPRNGGIYVSNQLAGSLIYGRTRSASTSGGVSGVALVLARQVGSVVRYYDGRGFSLAAGKYLPTSLSVGAGGSFQAWSFRLPTAAQGLVPGVYRVNVLARDRVGATATLPTLSFTVRAPAPTGDVTAPRVTISTPQNGGVYSATQTHFGALGSARDIGGSGIASLRVIAYRYADANGPAGYFNSFTRTFNSATPIENPALLAGTGTNALYPSQWVFDQPLVLTPGRFLVTAIARDRAGNRGTGSLTFTRR